MGAESTYWRCSCGFKGDIDAAADHVLGAAGEHELVADGARSESGGGRGDGVCHADERDHDDSATAGVMLALVPWVLMGGGAGVILEALAQSMVDVPLLVAGFAVAGLGAGFALADSDVLRDHPDEEPMLRIGGGSEHKRVDLDEERRRRGAAGWQKPVEPPSERPGGLPPKR